MQWPWLAPPAVATFCGRTPGPYDWWWWQHHWSWKLICVVAAELLSLSFQDPQTKETWTKQWSICRGWNTKPEFWRNLESAVVFQIQDKCEASPNPVCQGVQDNSTETNWQVKDKQEKQIWQVPNSTKPTNDKGETGSSWRQPWRRTQPPIFLGPQAWRGCMEGPQRNLGAGAVALIKTLLFILIDYPWCKNHSPGQLTYYWSCVIINDTKYPSFYSLLLACIVISTITIWLSLLLLLL